MSMGVNLMFKLVEDMARALGDGFDVEIIGPPSPQKGCSERNGG